MLQFNSLAALGGSRITFNGGILLWASGNAQDPSARFNAVDAGDAYKLDTNGNSPLLLGSLTGLGGLTKLGVGTLALGGYSTYEGTTTIEQGTLQIGDGTTNGQISSGPVVNNSALVYGRTDISAWANNISGLGTLSVGGASILTTGGTTVTAGTLILSGSNSYSGPTSIYDNASLILTGPNTGGGSYALGANALLQVGAGVNENRCQQRGGDEADLRTMAVQHRERGAGEDRRERNGERPGTRRQQPRQRAAWDGRSRLVDERRGRRGRPW